VGEANVLTRSGAEKKGVTAGRGGGGGGGVVGDVLTRTREKVISENRRKAKKKKNRNQRSFPAKEKNKVWNGLACGQVRGRREKNSSQKGVKAVGVERQGLWTPCGK